MSGAGGARPGGSDDSELALLLQKIEQRGLRVTNYKEPCLRRRIAVRMRARGVHTFADYGRVLDAEPGEFDLLLDALTINVTRFFRNPETYAALRERVVPELVARAAPTAVWSAGCATGEEPYSLAILFDRAAPRARVRIDATDLDPGALAFMARAEYPQSAVVDVPPDLLQAYFSPGPPYKLAERVRKLVTPVRHDLTHEKAPHPPYDLIVCRNVVIYFDRAMQERLFEHFHEALAPEGWLLLGKVETLFGKSRTLFKTADARERLFRKAA